MPDPQIGGGTINFELDGKTVQLVPSVEACIEISRMAGGLGAAVERCKQLHFETICGIVGAAIEINGARLNPGQREKMLPKAIYEAGIVGIAAICIGFITIVSNGGREVEDDDADEEDGEAPLE
jgi:hypothetical protein